jgi:peptidoglycan/LPS O-acetylase OafA/YrhL
MSLVKRFESIDELKGISIIMVVALHVAGVFGINQIFPLASAVDIFLIESGFSLMVALSVQPVREFIVKRLIRLVPAYWIAIIVFTAFVALMGRFTSIPSIILHVFGLQGFGPEKYLLDISPAWWYVTLILMCYGIFLALRKKAHDIPLMLFWCGVTTAVLTLLYSSTGNEQAMSVFPERIASFFVGMVAGAIYVNPGMVIHRLGSKLYRVALLAGIGGGLLGYAIGEGVSYYRFIAAAAIIVIWTLFVRKIVPRFVLASLVWIGLISYEIYLVFQPMVQDYARPLVWMVFGIANPSNTVLALWTTIAFILMVLTAWVLNKTSKVIVRKFRLW